MMIEKIEKSNRLKKRIGLLLGPIVFIFVVIQNVQATNYYSDVSCGSSYVNQLVEIPITLTVSVAGSVNFVSNYENRTGVNVYPSPSTTILLKMKCSSSGNGRINIVTAGNSTITSYVLGSCVSSSDTSNVLLYFLGAGIGVIFIMILKSVFA